MAKKNILAAMLKAFAKDADPDEVAAAVDAINQRDADEEKAKIVEALKPKTEENTQDEGEGADMNAKLAERLDALEERINKLFAGKQEDEEPEVEEEAEETKEVSEEEDITEDSGEDVEEEEKVVVSKDSLDALKVAVARIRNPQDKARANDALVKVYGRSKPATADVYKEVANLAAKSSQIKDSAPAINFEDLGKQIAAKWNPHYKEEK